MTAWQGDGDYSIAVATEDVPVKWSGFLQSFFQFDYKAQQGTSDSACPLITTYKVIIPWGPMIVTSTSSSREMLDVWIVRSDGTAVRWA